MAGAGVVDEQDGENLGDGNFRGAGPRGQDARGAGRVNGYRATVLPGCG
jgi:hypothetical protein